MKIACFLQTYNEVETGHLKRFLEWNTSLFDYLLVYDDGSTDFTPDYVRQHADLLIESPYNLFKQERSNKQQLLDLARETFPDVDWFLWLDADEVLYCSRDEIEQLLRELEAESFDGARLPHINLWRSEQLVRCDEYFDLLAPIRLWKNSERLTFQQESGLHGELNPHGLTAVKRLNFPAVVHYGFSSDELIMRKYHMYLRSGQSGWLLERLVSETGRVLEPLSERRHLLGSRYEEPSTHPIPPELLDRLVWATRARSDLLRLKTSDPLVTIVCLIYSSVEWLEFVYGEMIRLATTLREGEVELLFVANDATPEVLEYLIHNGIPHVAVNTRKFAGEWFINSVYRAYNLGVQNASGKFVYLINSDMAFDLVALTELLRNIEPRCFLVSRLVELGELKSGEHGIEKDFGAEPKTFRRRHFKRFASQISKQCRVPGGLYMPLLVEKDDFLSLGQFPEGNLTPHSFDDYLSTGHVSDYAQEGEDCIPGDRAFFERAQRLGYRHFTQFSSISYHFQAGERRTEGRGKRSVRSGIAIINDSIEGVNDETVLWGGLHQRLICEGIRSVAVGANGRLVRLKFHLYARLTLRRTRPLPRVIFSNATFAYPFSRHAYRVTLRQDAVSGPWLRTIQRWTLNSSDLVLANDPEFTGEQTRQTRKWMTVPLSDAWSIDAPPVRRLEHGIFVGAFNETKGWNSVRQFILQHPDIAFDLVSKYEDDDPDLPPSCQNCQIHRQLPQEELRSLFDRAGFFILGSPYETQCLAALEAASRNVAVLMPPTGLLSKLTEMERLRVGSFTSDLDAGWSMLKATHSAGGLNPRAVVERLMMLGDDSWQLWVNEMKTVLRESFVAEHSPSRGRLLSARILSGVRLKFRQVRRELLRPALNRLVRKKR